MIIKKNDFVEIEYVARVKEDNTFFDTTNPLLAEKEGIFSSDEFYGSVIVCVGKRSFLRANHWNRCIFGALPLEGKEVGKVCELEIPPEEAFGKRVPAMVQKVSKRHMREKGIFPRVGGLVPAFGRHARIVGEIGDKVIVDMNHPLADKHLIYTVKIIRIVTQTQEKVEALKAAWLSKESTIILTGNTLEIFIEGDCSKDKMMEETCDEIKELIPDVQAIICRKT